MDNIGRKKVAVGLSGGVDSSVAAHILKEQGYDVTGVYLQCWDARADGCTADADRKDAVKVASTLGIRFEFLDFIKEYKSKVIENFYKEYEAGRTPNPDILCNREIKFGMFLDWAMKSGFDYIATGHYARVTKDEEGYKLLKGIDETKDQSYFLYALDQEQLSKTIFPVGGMKKSEIRDIARDVGLHTYNKPDSVGICFIGEVDIRDFLKKRLEVKKGDVVNKWGEVIGEHDGVWFYTIGQRHGFSVTKYTGLPVYVVGKNIESNELIVGFAHDVLKGNFSISEAHWITREPHFPLECDVRVRHLGDLHPGLVTKADGKLSVNLKDPIFGVAPGQSGVFYLGDHALGGGIID